MVTVDHPNGIILSSGMLQTASCLPSFPLGTMKLRRVSSLFSFYP